MDYFAKKAYADIVSQYGGVPSETSDTSFLPDYAKEALVRLSGVELADDFRILDLEVAIQQNLALAGTEGSLSVAWALFALSGQGDFWLLNKHSDNIGFYDHNQENYALKNVTNLNLTLESWVILSDLFHQFDLLNENSPEAFNKDYTLKLNYRTNFVEEVESISSGLFEQLPFNSL